MQLSKNLIYYFSVNFMFIGGLLIAPIRIIYEFFTIKHPDLFRKTNNPKRHGEKVKKIQNQVKVWNSNGRKRLLCSSRASWKKFAMRDFDNRERNQIDVDLEDIIEIDTENQTITVEPRLKMGTLTYKLLPLGWTIPIIPELQELTVGGLICGFGIESSSNKYGDFTKQCLSYEIVLPSGECVTCSKNKNSDLFEAIPMSYGTLGFVTAVQFPLIPAKPFVELKYYPVTDRESAIQLLQNSADHEFVEGLQLGKDKFVIMYGDFVDSAPKGKIRTFLNWWDQVFHWDAETYFDQPSGSIQYIPLRDYYHRHTKAYFWCFSNPLSIHKWTIVRYTLGWGLPLNLSLEKFVDSLLPWGSTGGIRNKYLEACDHFLQDYIIPMNKLSPILDMIAEDLSIYPIWLCPIRLFPSQGMIQPIENQETLYVDVGVYGFCRKASRNLLDIWKKYEQYTLEHKGLIFFYTDSYLSRSEFEQMFPQDLYTEVRKKYNCDGAFPHIYDKVSFSSRAGGTKYNFSARKEK